MVNYHYIISGALLVILVAFIVIFLVMKKGKKELDADKEVKRFIRQSMKDGHALRNIRSILVDAGWPKKLVDLTIEKAKEETEKKLLGVIPIGMPETRQDRLMDRFANLLKREDAIQKELKDVGNDLNELKEREDEFLRLGKGRTEVKREQGIPPKVRKVLEITDELLGKLPDEEVEKFTQSEDFQAYKEVMEKVVGKEKEEGGKNIHEVVTLVKKGVLSEDEAREILGLPEKKRPKRALAKEKLPKKEEPKKEALEKKEEPQKIKKAKPGEVDMAAIKAEIEKKLKEK